MHRFKIHTDSRQPLPWAVTCAVCFSQNKYPHKPPPAIANWSSWSECSASCGQVGSKGRQCLTAGQSTPGSCLGSSTEVCYGKACTSKNSMLVKLIDQMLAFLASSIKNVMKEYL